MEYTRHMGPVFNLSIPFNLGVADYPTNDRNTGFQSRPFVGIDVLGQLKWFGEEQLINPALSFGLGTNFEAFDDVNLSLPMGMVLDIRLDENLYLSPKIEYRIGLGSGENGDNLMPAIGAKLLLGGAAPTRPQGSDRDGDGVPDDLDRCPDEPGNIVSRGCPDADGDGVYDGDDNCPTAAGTAALNGCPDADGDGVSDRDDQCPTAYGPPENQGCPTADTDGDRVPDDQDLCPEVPGLPAYQGCPDTDGDEVPDNLDACPRVPGPQATRGCPDTDGDGVSDQEDQCPSTPGLAANGGCPDLSPEEKEKLNVAARSIQFETGSAILKPASIPYLNEIARILQRYPDFRVSIDGHTDSIGSAVQNQKLSEQRAKACYDYLIGLGIAPDRMEYQGFGESRPIADNRFQEGREQNRRVEFNILR